MANYLDGMDGGKHNSDQTEVSIQQKTFDISVRFTDVSAKNPLDAAKIIASWLLEDANNVVYDVIDEQTKEKFTIDLGENDEDAVLPYKD